MNLQRYRTGILVFVVIMAAVAVGVFSIGYVLHQPGEAQVVEEVREVMGPPVPPAFEVIRVDGEFGRDSNLRDVFQEQGYTPQELHAMLADSREVYDFNKVKAGATYSLEKYSDGRFRRFLYNINREEYVIVVRNDEHFHAMKIERPVEVREVFVEGVIQTSLWNTITAQGESGELVMSIYEPMQWDVDFFALQPGDTFKAIVEKKFCEGEFLGYGQVQAINFYSGGKDFYAFQFKNPATGRSTYFDYEGKGVKKAFLKAPFKYDHRISSNFSASRLHPIYKVRKPHYGVDYAAPIGTPVLSSAAGRVVEAQYKGANGNYVKLRHPNGFYTYYLHLSKILVKAGQSVAQGQRIGLVGMTGAASGPHLDYRILDNHGKWLNPRKMIALPSETGVRESDMPAFIEVREAFIQRLKRVEPDLLMAGTESGIPASAAR